MSLTNLTDETKALMRQNNISPAAVGANQYMRSATPRLNAINLYGSSRNQTPITPITNAQNSSNSLNTSVNSLVNGGLSLMNGLNSSGVFNNKSDNSGGAISNAIGSFVNGNNENSDAGDILSGAGDLYGLAKTWGNSGSGAAGGALGGYGGLISGGINGLTSFAQSGDYKDGLQGFFSVDKDDSDVMQGVKGAINGAVTGGSIGGPWGALAGGILGLGSSFLDDI